jgi:hypothetical protein
MLAKAAMLVGSISLHLIGLNNKPISAAFMVLMKLLRFPLAGLLLLFGAQACNDKKIDLQSPTLEEYFPMQAGKYITYRLDSTVTTQFGSDTTVRSYRFRDRFDALITDGEGRPAWRVYRTISNVAGTSPYVPNNTFTATPVNGDWVEWNENNLRFMKLRFPILEGFTWPGNSFIDASSINSPVRYLEGWNYVYENIGQPITINGKTYNNTLTVLQRNEVVPEGPFNPNFFKQWDYSIEVYASGIGLIYKNFDHKVWQPPTPPPDARPGFYEDGSYRVVLSIIDHN